MNSGLFELIQTFVRVAELRSFTKVAEEQNSTQPTVSRQVTALEDYLGTRLFTRTTRSLSLTDEGRRFYEHAVGIIEATERAKDALSDEKIKLFGGVKIGCTSGFTRLQIVPRLKSFLEEWPDVDIDFIVDDRVIDIHQEDIDFVIRIGHITDNQLTAIKIADMKRIAIATPDYLEAHGTPTHPSDLENHQCIIYSGIPSPDLWRFAGEDDNEVQVKVNTRLSMTSADAAASAVVSGLGIGVAADWAFSQAIANGDIVRVLKEFEPPSMPINFVYSKRKVLSPTAKALIDFLAEHFRRHPILKPELQLSVETALMRGHGK